MLLHVLKLNSYYNFCNKTLSFHSIVHTRRYNIKVIFTDTWLNEFYVLFVLFFRNLSKEFCCQILSSLGQCIEKSEDKNVCAKSLWCLHQQNIGKDVVGQKVGGSFRLFLSYSLWPNRTLFLYQTHKTKSTIMKTVAYTLYEIMGYFGR